MNDNFRIWHDGKILLLVLSIVLCALTYAAWDSLVVMEGMWSTKEEYGYAYIIPVITAFFIWQRRYLVLNNKFVLSWSGFMAAIFGVLVLLLGVLSATHSITQYGYLIALVGSVWMFIGWCAFKEILGPLLLLFLIVPLPAFLFNNLSAYLQLISSEIGVEIIRLFGVSVYLEGNVIDLGTFKLQVVEACSGLRYLFPLFSLALIAAFMFKAEMWKRAVVVVSSLPITVFMNSFRIGVIGVLVEYYGIEQAEGFLHDFEGWIIFMACTGFLILEMWFLLKIGSQHQSLSEAFAIEAVNVPDEPYKNNMDTIGIRHIVFAVIIGLMTLSVGLISEKHEIVPARDSFVTFPLKINGWLGHKDTLTPDILDALKLTDYFIADYTGQAGDMVNLYMAYYERQKSGEAAHSPRSCIPGGGWQIKDYRTIHINGLTTDTQPLSVNRLLIRKGEYGQLVYYWFQQRNRIITNEYMVKLYLFWDSLTKSRTDGALIRLTTPVGVGEDLIAADERLVEFLQQVEPMLSDYIPD